MYLGQGRRDGARRRDLREPAAPVHAGAPLARCRRSAGERRERIILSGDIPSPIDPPPHAASRRAASGRSSPAGRRCRRSSVVEPEHDVACFNPVPAPGPPTTTEPGGSDGQPSVFLDELTEPEVAELVAGGHGHTADPDRLDRAARPARPDRDGRDHPARGLPPRGGRPRRARRSAGPVRPRRRSPWLRRARLRHARHLPGADRGPDPLVRRVGLPPGRLRERPLHELPRDQPRLLQRLAEAAGGDEGLVALLLGRAAARRGAGVPQPRRRGCTRTSARPRPCWPCGPSS